MQTIRIRAMEGALVPFRTEADQPILGRFYGVGPDGRPLPDGEEVADTQAVRKAVSRGALVLVEPPAAPAPPPAPAPASAPPTPAPAHQPRPAKES